MTEKDILDEILVKIGFGKRQALAFFLVCILVASYSSMHMAYVFTAMDTEYRCYVPICDQEKTEYHSEWVSKAIPSGKSGRLKKCEMFKKNSNSDDNCTADSFNSSQILRCSSYVFENYENYLGREFKIQCEENLWKLSLVGSINNIGIFCGSFFTGSISDRYGRKFVVLLGLTFCSIIGLIKTFLGYFEWFCVLEFLEAFFLSGTFNGAFILGAELVIPEHRVWSACALCSCYSIGEIFLALAAWSVKDWRYMIYIVYGCAFLLVWFLWYIPESVRWNLAQGNSENAIRTLKKFARSNGKSIEASNLHRLRGILHEARDDSIKFTAIFKSQRLLFRLINCCFLWLTSLFVWNGLTLNSITLAGDNYLNFVFIALSEIPANFIVLFLIKKFGGKFSLCTVFFANSFCVISCIFSSGVQHLIFYCLSKFTATTAYLLVSLITTELFPTCLRHKTIALCFMIGRIGTMVCPQIPILGSLWQPIPFILFATLSIISGISSLFLPETSNIKLPDTIEEAEAIGRKSFNVNNRDTKNLKWEPISTVEVNYDSPAH